MKDYRFCKCSHLIFLYVIGYDIFHGDPKTPTAMSPSKIDAYGSMGTKIGSNYLCLPTFLLPRRVLVLKGVKQSCLYRPKNDDGDNDNDDDAQPISKSINFSLFN